MAELFALRISLVGAKDLPASDFGFLGLGGNSDPYFTFQVGRNRESSSVRAKTLSPSWDPPHTFDFEAPRDGEIHVLAYDHDDFSEHDFLGSAVIPVGDLVEKIGHSEIVLYELEAPKTFKKHTKHSVVFLEIKALVSAVDLPPLYPTTRVRYTSHRAEVFNVWETEPVGKHSLSCKRWSRERSDKNSSDRFLDMAPPVPHGMVGDGWEVDLSHGGVDGWTYATSLKGPFQAEPTPDSIARQRKWRNNCSFRY